MSANKDGNGKLIKDVGYLRGRVDSMKGEIVEIKSTQNRIFDKIDDGQNRIFEKIDDEQKRVFEKIDSIHCQKESTFENIKGKLKKVEKAISNGVKEKAIAKGWLLAMEWFIKISLVVTALIIAYKTFTVT